MNHFAVCGLRQKSIVPLLEVPRSRSSSSAQYGGLAVLYVFILYLCLTYRSYELLVDELRPASLGYANYTEIVDIGNDRRLQYWVRQGAVQMHLIIDAWYNVVSVKMLICLDCPSMTQLHGHTLLCCWRRRLTLAHLYVAHPQPGPSLFMLNSLPIPLSPFCLYNLFQRTLCMFQNGQFTSNDPFR